MNTFTIDVDTAALTEALLTLPQALKPFVKAAARISAEHIRDEAAARLERQLSGTSTGETVAGIKVKTDRTGWGWVVDAGNLSTPMLDRWLEGDPQHGGFKNAKRRKPFFWDSARLEEEAHASRIQAAVVAGLSEHGLGGLGT